MKQVLMLAYEFKSDGIVISPEYFADWIVHGTRKHRKEIVRGIIKSYHSGCWICEPTEERPLEWEEFIKIIIHGTKNQRKKLADETEFVYSFKDGDEILFINPFKTKF